MVETRMIVIFLVCLLMVAVMAWVFIKIWRMGPDVDIFPYGKEKLVRYYACSLAICTKGCSWLESNQLCIEKDIVTEDCDLWCHDVCNNRFEGCPGTGDCCGKPYNLSLPIEMDTSLKGCMEWMPTRRYGGDCVTEIWKMFPKIDKVPQLEDIIPSSCEYSSMYKSWAVDYKPGGIYDESYERTGEGGIFLDSTDALEKFGCSDEVISCPPAGCINPRGFYHCLLRGNLNIWTDWDRDDCADVFVNSTISEGGYDIYCTSPLSDGSCSQEIKPRETAEYTIEINNYLGTGSDFTLISPSYTPDTLADPKCRYLKDGEEITELYVDDGLPNDFTLSCKPTETAETEAGKYTISITADRYGGFSETTAVILNVVDFDFLVNPTEPQKKVKEKPQSYRVSIRNKLDKNENFVLTVSTETITGGTLTCTFDENNKTTLTMSVANKDSDYRDVTCRNGPGDYKITFGASGGGIPKPDEIRTLYIRECEGEIDLTIPSRVEFGESFDAYISGLENCDGRIVKFTLDGTDIDQCEIGRGCEPKTFTADDVDKFYVGEHTLDAKVELTGDEPADYDDEGEKDSEKLEIYITGPVGGFQRVNDRDWWEAGNYWYTIYDWGTASCTNWDISDCKCEWRCYIWIPFNGCISSGYNCGENCPFADERCDDEGVSRCYHGRESCSCDGETDLFDSYCWNSGKNGGGWFGNGYCYEKMCISEVDDSTYRPIGGCMDIMNADSTTQETCINAWGTGSCSGNPSTCSCSGGTLQTIYDGYVQSVGNDEGYGYARVCLSSSSGKKVVGSCMEVWDIHIGSSLSYCNIWGQAYCTWGSWPNYGCQCSLGVKTGMINGTTDMIPGTWGEVGDAYVWNELQEGWSNGRLYFCVID